MARPRSGDWLEDEIAGWRAEGIGTVVSLLEDSEIADLELARQPALCAAAGITLLRFPIPDRGVPADRAAALRLCRTINAARATGDVAIHCRAGIGRSSLIAALSLTVLDMTADDAFARIREARGLPVPDTDEQRAWVAAAAEGAFGLGCDP